MLKLTLGQQVGSVIEREETPPTLGVQAGLWAYPLAHRVEAFPKALAAKGIGHNIFRTFDRLKTSDDQFVVLRTIDILR